MEFKRDNIKLITLEEYRLAKSNDIPYDDPIKVDIIERLKCASAIVSALPIYHVEILNDQRKLVFYFEQCTNHSFEDAVNYDILCYTVGRYPFHTTLYINADKEYNEI